MHCDLIIGARTSRRKYIEYDQRVYYATSVQLDYLSILGSLGEILLLRMTGKGLVNN